MSAGIETNDTIVATEKTWHGLERIESEINFANSGLAWSVSSKPLYLDADSGPINNWQAIVREDKNLVLNIPKASYAIIQNERVWQALEESLKGVNYQVVTAGSLHDCKKIFIAVALKEAQEYVVNRERFNAHVTFMSSHDGSTAFEAFDCVTRVVCANTLAIARGQKGSLNVKAYHTTGNEFKIQALEQHIQSLFAKRAEFFESYEYLTSRTISQGLAEKVLAGFLGDGKTEQSTRAKNTISDIMSLFYNGAGNQGKTYADLLNGVTDYYTHSCNKKSQFKNFTSSEFGSGADKKAEFFNALMSDDEIKRLETAGEKLLLATA